MGLGSKIKQFGLKNFGSLQDFAKALDIVPAQLSAYIHERRGPGSPFLKKMRDLGCDLNWLFDDNEAGMVREGKIDYKSNRIMDLEEENKQLKKRLNNIKKNLEGDGL